MKEIWTPERKAIATATAQSWLGTPFLDRGGTRHGIDCVHFLLEVYSDAGIVERRPLGSYSTTAGLRKPSTQLLDTLKRVLWVVEADLSEIEFGDVVLCKTGRSSAHCAFYADGVLFHSLARVGVASTPLNHWLNRVGTILRLTRVGWRDDL